MADSKTAETDQFRWKAIEVEVLRISWSRTEPTSAARMTSRKKKDTAFLTWRERGDEANGSDRTSPIQINVEGMHRTQQEIVIEVRCKIGQRRHQEGARDGTGERLRLGHKLRNIRDTGGGPHKGNNTGESL